MSMQTSQVNTRTSSDSPSSAHSHEELVRQVRQLQERLAFYEGFDSLIQDNVAHARELFRLAAQERETATSGVDRERAAAAAHASVMRSELEVISQELATLAGIVDALARRVAIALNARDEVDVAPGPTPSLPQVRQRAAIVVHGVASARAALSLQRFVGALPQVTEVAAREFAGGVLRLDALLQQPLQAAQFGAWDTHREVSILTDRPDVIEFALVERDMPLRLAW